MKRFIILLLAILIGCATAVQTPTEKPVEPQIPVGAPSTEIEFSVAKMRTNFDLVNRKVLNEERCYFVVLITELPGANNVWATSGFKPGDLIVLYGNRPGAVAELPCSHNTADAIKKWFRGKARPYIKTPEGWPCERMRFTSRTSFTLQTIAVSIHNKKENYIGPEYKYDQNDMHQNEESF